MANGGGINGTNEAKILTVTFDFPDNDTCQLQLIKDGSDSKSFQTEEMTIKKGQKINVQCLPRGGFTGILR